MFSVLGFFVVVVGHEAGGKRRASSHPNNMYGVFSVRNEPDYSLGGDGYSHYSCPNTNDDYAQVADSTDGYHHYSLAQKVSLFLFNFDSSLHALFFHFLSLEVW